MPFTIDITTIRVVVAITTPSRVRNERSLWVRSASNATQKASRAVTHKVRLCTLRARFCMADWGLGGMGRSCKIIAYLRPEIYVWSGAGPWPERGSQPRCFWRPETPPQATRLSRPERNGVMLWVLGGLNAAI